MTRAWTAWRDVVFLAALAVYAVNRWVARPFVPTGFWREHANDVLLIPVLVPIMMEIHGWLGWRPAGVAPRAGETLLHFAVWSVLCEGVGPAVLGLGTADARDVLWYGVGAVGAQVWWIWRWPAREARS